MPVLSEQEKRYFAIREEAARMWPDKSKTYSKPPLYPEPKKPEPEILNEHSKKQPVSIIIAAYKVENFIKECLDSIENQEYFKNNDNFQVLLGIDACDETLDKVKNIGSKYRNLQVFMMKENKGPYVTLNTLLDLAKYENIIVFGADDVMKPNMVEEIMHYSNDYNVIRFQFDDFTHNIKFVSKSAYMRAFGTIFYKKNVIDSAGGYREWRYSGDFELLKRISGKIKLKELADSLFYRRDHPESLLNKEETELSSKLIKKYNKEIRNYESNENYKIDKVINKYEEIKIPLNLKPIDSVFYLSRIMPKKVFFYWGGSDLSWMRYMTLYSFRKMNPDWEITLYVSDNNIKNKGWNSCENQDYYTYKGKNYFDKLNDLNIKIEPAKFPEEISDQLKDLSPIHKGDLFRYYKLYVEGGFYCDMDILFFKPISNFYNEIINKKYDTVIHEYESKNTSGLTIGFLGASVNNEFFKNLFEFGVNYYINKTQNGKIEDSYQSMGIELIYKMFNTQPHLKNIFNDIVSKYPYLRFINLPTSLIYKFDWTQINYCFTNALRIINFDKNSIGYHWYGGGKDSQYYNNILNEKNYKKYKTTFSVIADEIINMKVDKKGDVISNKKPKVSIVMTSYNRAELLNLGLSSILNQKIDYPFEIVVVNDGADDNTENVCNSYKDKLNIKYIFSGYRNLNGMIYRSSPIPINIGIKKSEGDIIILSCAEIYHLTHNTINEIVKPLIENKNYLVIPDSMHFDNSGEYTEDLLKNNSSNKVNVCELNTDHVQMPFLMGIWKQHILDIGGYDEDLIGYASEDNDFVDRLKLKGCKHHKVNAKIVHLYHGKRCLGVMDGDNPDWVYNYKLYQERKGILVRNVNREWGSNIRISIVTAYYNRKKQFYETLKSISRSKFKDFELIVVDDASDSEYRLEELVSEFSFLKIIRIEPKDKWYVNSCIPFNIGIRSALGDVIILQNPECLHVNDVLTYVNENIDDTKYLTMSAYGLDEENSKKLSKYIDNNEVEYFLKKLPQISMQFSSNQSGWYNHSIHRPVYFHFCSAITKKNMNLLGGFDEKFASGIAFEDSSFVEKVTKLGLNKIIADQIFVIHQFHEKPYEKIVNFQELYMKNKQLFKNYIK